MKKWKKGLLAGVPLSFAVLAAGCGAGDNNGNEEVENNAAGAEETNVEETNTNNEAADNGNEEANSGSEDFEGTTLSFLVDNQTVTDGIEAVAAEVEEQYGITVETQIRPGGTEGDNIVKTRLATGDMTDIMWYNSGSLFKALNPEEYFYDISEEEFVERIDETFLETVTVDEKTYGIPGASASAGGWMYNKEIYDELGLEVPNTWDELLENNDAIKEAGYTPVVASFGDTWTSQLVVLADYYNVQLEHPDFADEYTANEAKFADTPGALRSFEKMQELSEAGHFNEEETSTTYEEGLRMLAEGEAAHYPMLTFSLPALEDTYGDAIENIGFFGQPGEDAEEHGLTLWMPGGIYANKDSENLEAAKKFMEFFISEEGQEIYMEHMKAEGPYVLKDVELPDDAYPAVQDMSVYLDEGKVAPALEFLSPLKGPNLEQILVEVGMGLEDAEAGAENYDRDVERQAQQLDLEGWE
ncbi:extracellular solute-binding protein [Alkalicoccus daliensis]|uniref:Raffinose/stachyose/melibiose transport system substrate-binding protein n=1 Tax=Alkalicoccus daliensis TaxID=745820 RepID=A0A1H0F2W2_9BACI|nr:extracellular solute-binding protein [Alkalicoccus daliensis]SDN88879.1 raffinose/stachyose/melibiose transport system substrate-binding protein [Alkalicoccus daliensis]